MPVDPSANAILQKKLTRLQVGVWIVFYLFLVLYTMQKWEFPIFSFWAATIATSFYLLAAYGHAGWLIPRFYQTNKRAQYYLYTFLFLTTLLLLRMYAEHTVLYPLHLKFYNWTLAHFAFVFVTNFLAFLFGALIKIAAHYIILLRKQEELNSRHLASELNLLKSQVQPHFLFNTLNNIYYLAYTKNEKTAEVVARLSDIMRYFVDEAPKEKVPIDTEMRFIKNYIELEQIRMRHPVQLSVDYPETTTSRQIPPMLLIPLVENIYKHGVDKTVTGNTATITLQQEMDYWLFTTQNIIPDDAIGGAGGSGLNNLRKRLELLYGKDFVLSTAHHDHVFTAILKFPVTA
jgi:sensor histidine kinase YesM